jgi:superfamily II DNA or RNA helicase
VVQGPEKALAELRHSLRFHPKNYFRSDAYQLYKMSGGERGWDGYRYPFMLKSKDIGEVLRGRKDEVIAFCQQGRYAVDTSALLESPFPDLTVEAVPDDLIASSFTLDAHQKAALVAWLTNGTGVARMAVNSGKTALFAAAAALIKRKFPSARFLYFTFSERLANQVYNSMVEFLPGWHITQYGGGPSKRNRTGKDMVVATQAMLNRNFYVLLEEKFFQTFMGLLLDESHHCASPSAERILLSSSSYFRLGASDSTKESDPDKWNKIMGLVGPIRYELGSDELISSGRSAAPTLYLIDVPEWKNKFRDKPHEVQPNTPAWTLIDGTWVKCTYLGPVPALDDKGNVKMQTRTHLEENRWVREKVPVTVQSVHLVRIGKDIRQVPARYTMLDRRYDHAIIRFKERNELIVRWAEFFSNQGKPTLIVATRTSHILVLESLVTRVLPKERVLTLYGEDTPATRNKALAWLKATPDAVLITPLIKEGVSINELRAGIIADPVADPEVARQIVGRFMRKKEDNNFCEIVWFVDRQHPRYQANTLGVIGCLECIEGFTFYWPVAGPETIDKATIHQGRKDRRICTKRQ